MKSIHRTFRMLAAFALAAAAFLPQAEAAPVVTISPASQNIGVTGTATVDIVVSGLTEPSGGFAFVLDFDSLILSGLSYSIDPGGQLGPFVNDGTMDFSFGFGTGTLDIFYVANVAANLASQAASFTLATVSFTGIADGTSALTFSSLDISKADGITTQSGVTSTPGSICVGTCAATVPEPASLALVATAIGLLGLRRRRSA